MSWFTYKNPELVSEGANIEGLNLGFSSKEDQHVVLRHIHEFCKSIGISHRDLALANQIHSTNVLEVTTGGVYPNVDAFVSKTPGVALGIQVADCGAILFGDFDKKIIGAAHAGWRGAVNGIIPNTINKMVELGADPRTTKVFVSACLAKHNFEVGDEVAELFPKHLVNITDYKKPHVDLSGLIFEQLIDAEVLSSNIEVDNRCTIDNKDDFYSYRREGEKSGRMLAVVRLNKL
jgi:YfiH family protein